MNTTSSYKYFLLQTIPLCLCCNYLFFPLVPNMSFFHHEEPRNPSNRCRCLMAAIRDALATCNTFCAACHTFCRKISYPNEEEDHSSSDYDDEQEVFVSAVLSKYMEAKSRRKVGFTLDSFIWDFSPRKRSPPTKLEIQQAAYGIDEEEKDEFYSVGSRLSRCSSASSAETFLSVKTNLSRCSSMSRIEFPVFRRRYSIFRELRHCEGWPFGLCRKARLLPPLPKSPAESWLWSKSTRVVKIS